MWYGIMLLKMRVLNGRLLTVWSLIFPSQYTTAELSECHRHSYTWVCFCWGRVIHLVPLHSLFLLHLHRTACSCKLRLKLNYLGTLQTTQCQVPNWLLRQMTILCSCITLILI